MSDFLLTQVINYGAPFLGVVVFVSALGAPFPATLVVVAVGAFARQGLLPWHITGLVALACVVIGDCLGFALGHYARRPVLRRFGASDRWLKAERYFQRWGGLAVFFSRFLVTAIATPVNIIAGTSNLRFRSFLTYDLTGEAIWIFGYGGLGYLFGSQWEVVSNFLDNMSGVALGLILLAVGIWLAFLVWRRNEEAKQKVPDS